MARSRLASIWPPGAIRLVPTLMTTLIRGKLCLRWNGIALDAGGGSLQFVTENVPGEANRKPGGEGQYPYPAIKMGFWQDEKTCTLRVVCLLPTLPAAFPIGSITMCATDLAIQQKCWTL